MAAEEITVIVDDSQEQVSLFVSDGLTKEELELLNVAFTDEENEFIVKQRIARLKRLFFGTSGGANTSYSIREEANKLMIDFISTNDTIGSTLIYDGIANSFIGEGVDLGTVLSLWKDAYFDGIVAAEGFETDENDSNKLLRSDGSVNGLTVTADTSTTINLGNILGNLCNMSSANATTTYTLTGTVTGGNARVLINALTEPIITGGTNISGSDFSASTDMYLVVFNNGNVTQFWFEEI